MDDLLWTLINLKPGQVFGPITGLGWDTPRPAHAVAHATFRSGGVGQRRECSLTCVCGETVMACDGRGDADRLAAEAFLRHAN